MPIQRIFIDTGGETCPMKGSLKVFEALNKAIQKAGLEGQVEVVARGCFGLCSLAPNLYIEPDNVWYSKFTLKDVPVIVRQHLMQGKPVERLIHYPERAAVEVKKKRRIQRVRNSRSTRNRSRRRSARLQPKRRKR